MKTTKKVSKTLILSAAAALAFGAVAAGTTYALFTSEANNEVTVVSGKVALKTEIKDLKLYSLSETTGEVEEIEGETFTNGGTVVIDGDKVALDKITPGDKVEFTIVVTNESNVDIKYHKFFQTLNDTGLCDGLDVKVDGEAYDGSTVNGEYENWLQSDENKTKEIKISIELPVDKGNAYQEKKCEFSFKYEAIQKNAKVEAVDESTFAIYTSTDLAAFAKKINTKTYNYDKTILMNDIDMDGLNYTSPIYEVAGKTLEFDGNGHTIKNLTPIENKDGSNNYGTGLIGKVSVGSLNLHDLTMENVTAKGKVFTVAGDQFAGAGAIVGLSDAAASNITISNVSISNVSVSGAKYGGAIIGYNSLAVTGTITLENITVNNANVSTYTAGGLIGQNGGGKAVINGVKGSEIAVSGYKREGGIVGAHSGVSLDITYDEAQYASTITDNAIADRGSKVGLTGKTTTINGQNYYTVTSTSGLNGLSGLSADHLNVVEIAKGSYDAAGLSVFKNVAGGVQINGRGDKDEIVWTQTSATDKGYSFNGTNVTMNNVTVKAGTTGSYQGFPGAGSMTFENCNFPVKADGEAFWYWGNGAVKFTGCTFDAEGGNDNNMMAYGGKSFEFDSCAFISDDAAIKLYQETKTEVTEINVTIKNCTFENKKATKWGTDKSYKTALSFDTSSAEDKVHWNVVATNMSISGNYADGNVADHAGLFGVRTPANAKKSHVSITLDGTAIDLGLPE